MSISKGRRDTLPIMPKGMTAQRMEAGAMRLSKANARRVQCPHCPLTIAPDGLVRHIAIVHDEEE